MSAALLELDHSSSCRILETQLYSHCIKKNKSRLNSGIFWLPVCQPRRLLEEKPAQKSEQYSTWYIK